MGGPSVSMSQPQAPSPQDEVKAWTDALPTVYQDQMNYQLPMAQAQKSAMEQLYPTTAGLQESLAKQASQGMSSDMPAWMKQGYLSNVNSTLGNQAGAPIGADYSSRGLLQQQQNYRDYYNNMAMSLAGRQPLASPSLDYMSGFTPNSVMQGMNQNYATSGNIYGSQLGYQSAQNSAMMNLIGSGVGAAGSMYGSAASAGII